MVTILSAYPKLQGGEYDLQYSIYLCTVGQVTAIRVRAIIQPTRLNPLCAIHTSRIPSIMQRYTQPATRQLLRSSLLRSGAPCIGQQYSSINYCMCEHCSSSYNDMLHDAVVRIPGAHGLSYQVPGMHFARELTAQNPGWRTLDNKTSKWEHP